jgi:hypothetical protein
MTKLIAGYLSSPDGSGAVSFALGLDSGNFSWIGQAPAANGVFSNISRLHFYSDDGNSTPLAVISCLPGGSSVKLDSSNLVTVSLTLENLLSGNGVTLDAYLRADGNGNPVFSYPFNFTGPGFWIGTKSGGAYDPNSAVAPSPYWSQQSATAYAETFAGLTLSQGVADSVFGTKWIDIPETKASGSAPFEAVSRTDFNSEHLTFHIRPVTLDGSDNPQTLPVLTIRRGYSVQNKADWPIVFPLASNPASSGKASDPPLYLEVTNPNGTDSLIHSTQFPIIGWLRANVDDDAGQGKTCQPPTSWLVETSGFTSAETLDFWNECIVAPYLAGLRAVNAALPISFLPTIQATGQPTGPGAEFDWRVVTSVSENGTDASGLPLLKPNFTRLLPGGLLDNEDQQPSGQVPAAAALTAVRTHDQSALSFSTTLNYLGAGNLFETDDKTSKKTILSSPAPNYFDMQFQASGVAITPYKDGTLPKVRLGSLDLTLAAASAKAPLAFQAVFQPNPLLEGGWLPRVNISLKAMPIANYGPGGQDPPPITSGYTLNAASGAVGDQQNFTQAAPIVIDAAPPPPTTITAYTIDVTESTIPAGNPQQVVLTLRSLTAGGSVRLQVLVLDPEPFLAARVQLNAPAQSIESDDTLIGNWCNLFPEGPGWRLQAGASGFKLSLPPQAVGEAMVKGMSADDSNAPQAGQPVDFRFSPPMTAQLLASYNAQNAVEPGWNTRRVLGNPSQSAPGAALDAANGGAEFEFLYGLTTSVTQPNLRLSEIFARLGSLPGPLPTIASPFNPPPGFTGAQSTAYKASATNWSRLYKQLLSKPAVLELWDATQGEDLVLDTGVDFTIRTNTDSKFPLPQPSPGSKVPPGSPSVGSFDGGLGYALDSANVATELLLQPNSVAGKLVQPRFTAFGGYGAQRAEFANGKVIVDTHTAMGRIETLTVTLVGRVGVLWNHALHVTVYERTVEPSQQFEDEQDEFPGVPLLRKTSEYVELLQTTRSYPESATGNPVTCGFIQGSAFKSIRIPVDSAWGSDVSTTGWQVPLWKPGAQPAPVYPTPHIALMVAVDPALGVEAVHSEMSDPDKLCFYTDTQLTTTSDTDSWPPVPDIDFTTQIPYSDSDQANLVRLDDLDPSVDPGFGQFTYHFVPSQTQVNVVSARTQATAVGARLSNASMMRGQLQQPLATGKFTLTSNPASGDTITINGTSLTFINAGVTPQPGQVALGATLTDTATALQQFLAQSTDHNIAQATYDLKVGTAVITVTARSSTTSGSSFTLSAISGAIQISAPTLVVPSSAPAQFGRVKDWWTATQSYLEQRAQQGKALETDAQGKLVSVTRAQQKYMQQLANDLGPIDLVNSYCQTISNRLNSALNRANGQGTTLVNNILVNFPLDLENSLMNLVGMDAATYSKALKAQVTAAVQGVKTTLTPLLGDYGKIITTADAYIAKLKPLNTDIQSMQGVVARIGGGATAGDFQPLIARWLPASAKTAAQWLRPDLDQAAQLVDQASQFLLGSQGTNLVARFDATWDAAMTQLNQMAATQVIQPTDPIVVALNRYIGTTGNPGTLAAAVSSAITSSATFDNALTQATPSDIDLWIQGIATKINSAIDTASTGTVTDIKTAVTTVIQGLSGAAIATQVSGAIQKQTDSIKSQAAALCTLLAQDLNVVKQAILNFAQQEFSSILNAASSDVNTFLASLHSVGQQIESQLAQVAQGVEQDIQEVATVVGEPLRLLRAFGEPPQVPTMSFNGPSLGIPLPSLKYVFNDLLPNVNMTPVLAGVAQEATGLVNAASKALSQLGMSLPTSALLDRFVPDINLANFDLNSVLPNFAGLNLGDLLSGLKMPDAARNFIHVTHKIDPQTKRASLDADIDFPLTDTATLMDIGPVAVQLSGARFTAHVHCDAAVGQQITQTSSGQISGNWVLLIGGVPLVTFVKTALTFDSSGHLTFSVNPANVQLASVLQFLADIINSFDFGDSGFSMHATAQPLLVQCILDLPLPDMSGGAFGIQNLELGAVFEIGVDDASTFFLGVGANLGRQTAPFDLTIFILGGAGWMESYLRYNGGKITGTIDIGIAASASLAISLGPIDGSVCIYFGLFATLQIGNGGGFQLGIMLLIDGRVNLLGIVDADISLLLEAEYSSGGGLTGRGVLSVSIKICWCFTLDVHTGVQYSFGAAASPSQPQQAQVRALSTPVATKPICYTDYYQAANSYVTMLA